MATTVRYLWEYGQTQDGNYIGKSDSKLGFYGATPVARQTTSTTATDAATAITAVNALKTALDNLGLTA